MRSAPVRIAKGSYHETELVKHACHFKNIPFVTSTRPDNRLCLATPTIEVIDILPILAFLEDKYPAPPLILGDPEVKAGINMVIQAYLRKPENTIEQLLEETSYATPWLLGAYPTVIDLMLVNHIDTITHRPYQFKLEELTRSWTHNNQ